MMKGAVITISKTGEVEIDAVGFKGKGCADFTKFLAQDLGEVKDDKKKPDWSLPEPSKQTVKLNE